jgi:hypothetical protein
MRRLNMHSGGPNSFSLGVGRDAGSQGGGGGGGLILLLKNFWILVLTSCSHQVPNEALGVWMKFPWDSLSCSQ